MKTENNIQLSEASIKRRITYAKRYPYLNEMHPEDRADYLKGKYNSEDKIRFLCPVCGEYYKQTTKNKRKGRLHWTCATLKRAKTQRTDEAYHSFNDLTPEFQEKCRNKELTRKDRVDFICPICKEIYSTLLGSHVKGASCRKCAARYKRETHQPRTDYDFIDEIHPDDRHLIGKVNNKSKVRIKCSDCKEYFYQVIASRANGFTRCEECGYLAAGTSNRRREYEFVNPLREDYATGLASGEIRTQDRVMFICPVHGEYEQILMSGQFHGCQACTIGLKPHHLYEFLLTLTDNIIVNDRQQIKPKEIDFYLPDYNIGFEFNDIGTHRTLWKEQLNGTARLFGKPVKYHLNKFNDCRKADIRLFQIWDVEWNNEHLRSILQSVIRNALGLNTKRIYARKCKLVESNSKECNPFFIENHIQGQAKGKGYFALKYKNEIVGAICYTDNQRILTESNAITISRMCFAKDTTVVGGASRLLNAVEKKTNCDSIEYLVLNDYFDGISFEKTGWEKVGVNIMVRYHDKETGKLYYRQIARRNEFKQRCLEGKMDRYYTSGTTVYRKTKTPSL
ncbi:MAG: hypothetical protein WC292_00085 [Clostridia bacterium]